MNYDLATLIINLFVAIGTVGAVVVSLFFTVMNRREKLRINMSIESEYIFEQRETIYWVIIRIINIGFIDFRLNDYHVYVNNKEISDDVIHVDIPFPLNSTAIPSGGVINITSLVYDFESYVNPNPGHDYTMQHAIEIINNGSIIVTTSRGKNLKVKFPESFIEDYRRYWLKDK
ncbi:MAG: hypothetical protein PHC50_05420 [Candidatus Cloacimonetes bacterium]|nr:hypothetical protein [Candidatus Cloacimonadota bacterium]